MLNILYSIIHYSIHVSEFNITQLEMSEFFDLQHQTIDVRSFAESQHTVGVLTKEVFYAFLGLHSVSSRDTTCERMTHVNFSPVFDECHVIRLPRKSKSNASTLIMNLITTRSI